MIAIHNGVGGFHPFWKAYCLQNQIEFKIVNCYANDIVEQLKGCDALLWHHSQSDPRDIILAKKILFAAEHSGMIVFPNFNSNWHFDDKVAQKYLFEFLNIPHPSSLVFIDKNSAIDFAKNTEYPIVFKLKGGAGSSNVRLVKNKKTAINLIEKSFSKGHSPFNSTEYFIDNWKKWRLKKVSFNFLLRSFYRLFKKPDFVKALGNEYGYAYFQKFVPNNDSDTRIIVIGNKAFGLKRYVRTNDFRASGSGNFKYNRDEFDERCVKLAFELKAKVKAQCIGFDFVFDSDNNPLVVEISYGFFKEVYDPCPGYWDESLIWHEENFDPQGWMVDLVIQQIRLKRIEKDSPNQ